MRLLLDTHIWIWMSESPERIRAEVVEAIDNQSNVRFMSAAVAYEVALKWAIGKLELPQNASDWINDRIRIFQAQALPITIEHASVAASLPMHHRDPFDRLLIAQAKVDGFTLVTADAAFQNYAIPLLWAA